MANPQQSVFRSIATIRGHTFFPRPLRPGCLVVDLGANRGDFTREMSTRFGARCFTVEASPSLAAAIPRGANVDVFNYAISAEDRPITFHIHKNSESSSALAVASDQQVCEVHVDGRKLDTFLAENRIDQVDLLKVDIEGSEVALFGSVSDATLDRIAQITIEFHDFLGLISREDVARIVERLKANGFYPIRFSRSNMNWLFVRTERCGISAIERLYVRYFVRNVRFFARAFRIVPVDNE